MSTRSPYHYIDGLKEGAAVGLAYLSVSFGFGLTAVSLGIQAVEAILISMTNLTSAGQVAGITVIAAAGSIAEMILTQLVINSRYALMGISLTQKLSPECTTLHRLLMSFGITDEIFALASAKPKPVGPSYFYGLMTAPYIGWAAGTAMGAFAGQLLPENLRTALGVMIYAMFLAIILPPAKKDVGILFTILLSAGMSCCIYYIPFFSFISEGFSIIICALVSAAVISFLRPAKEEVHED